MILHILRKDFRRLWPGIAASWVVLGALARQDRWRSDQLAGPVENYLNLLVPILWGCLVALAVEQDPVPGERQFWITRPFRRGAMLAAKLLFALLVAHIPSLIADCYVLAARGFSPIGYAPQLLGKQLVWACALSIPAMALASLVRSFSHFVMELVAVAAVFLVLAGPLSVPAFALEPLQSVRQELVVVLAVVAGAVILATQYLGRRVLLSRVIGGTAGAAATLLFVLLAPPSALAIRAAVSPTHIAPAVQLDPEPRTPRLFFSRQVSLAIPIAITGVPEGAGVYAEVLRSELLTSSGERYSETRPTRYDPMARRTYDVHIASFDSGGGHWLLMNIEPGQFAGMSAGPVILRGEASLGMYRLGTPTSMRVGVEAAIAGLGRCATSVVDDPFRQSLLRVECESPGRDPGGTRVRVSIPNQAGEWKRYLGSARMRGAGPEITWLSPLRRDLTFFQVGGDQRGISRDALDVAQIEITPQISIGYAAVHYEFRNLDLRRYVVTRPTRAGAR